MYAQKIELCAELSEEKIEQNLSYVEKKAWNKQKNTKTVRWTAAWWDGGCLWAVDIFKHGFSLFFQYIIIIPMKRS